MENIFNFEYEVDTLQNRDNTNSRFAVVYGEAGQIISCKKDSYNVIKTNDVNVVAQEFIDRGYNVSPYVYKHGELIGLNIPIGQKPSKVGDSTYNFFLNIPNNGTGMGYLLLHIKRLICTNGMVRTIGKEHMRGIRIPHNWSYNAALQLVSDVITTNIDIINESIERDESLSDELIDNNQLTFELNRWFFEKEMPITHKKDMSFTEFREILYSNPTQIKCIDRYTELLKARNKELEYNEELGLKLSKYTVMATITNYLTRRIEKSGSSAPIEIQYERSAAKLVHV